MLENLHVKNLVLIKEADLDFTKGLNILSGETGAGKSILIGSINVALGLKPAKNMVSENADYGLVELTFSMNERIKDFLLKNDYPIEEDSLFLSRKIKNGKSQARLNGQSITNSLLKELTEKLLDIHGQHEHQSLLKQVKHLEILDALLEDQGKKKKDQVSRIYHDYQTLLKKREDFSMDEEERFRQVDFLQYEIKEIENLNLKEGEDLELEERFRKISQAQRVMESLGECQDAFEGQGGILERIGYSLRGLSRFSEDPDLSGIYGQLLELEDLIKNVSYDLSGKLSEYEFDQEEVFETEERLNQINRLKDKYGDDFLQIQSYKEEAEKKLELLMDYENEKNRLEVQIQQAEKEFYKEAQVLSEFRKKAAKELEKKIIQSLLELNFLDVKFKVLISSLEEPKKTGIDQVSFLISTNPGQPLFPLNEVASGGELSRIMLAIKNILADEDDVESMIFDEIDTGISGRTAEAVGEKLCRLSRKRQVICITHLPQIAAMADKHFLIEKKVKNQSTETNIYPLNQEERVDELARMLGGVKITDAVLSHAREMIFMANEKKAEG